MELVLAGWPSKRGRRGWPAPSLLRGGAGVGRGVSGGVEEGRAGPGRGAGGGGGEGGGRGGGSRGGARGRGGALREERSMALSLAKSAAGEGDWRRRSASARSRVAVGSAVRVERVLSVAAAPAGRIAREAPAGS